MLTPRHGGTGRRALAGLVVGLLLGGCSDRKEAPIVVPVEQPSAVAPPTGPVEMGAATSLSRTLELARGKMVDGSAVPSEGTMLLASWAVQNLAWSDVDVGRQETTLAFADKDPHTNRAKRLCEVGEIVELEVGDALGGNLTSGILVKDAEVAMHLLAVGSTGVYGPKSKARFCGIVTGRYDRNAAAGGPPHAVFVVGMFDLPENREPPPSAGGESGGDPARPGARRGAGRASGAASSGPRVRTVPTTL